MAIIQRFECPLDKMRWTIWCKAEDVHDSADKKIFGLAVCEQFLVETKYRNDIGEPITLKYKKMLVFVIIVINSAIDEFSKPECFSTETMQIFVGSEWHDFYENDIED